MQEDQVLHRIRQARHRISEACSHDPYKVVQYYIELQKQHEKRLIQPASHQEKATDGLVKT